VSSAGDDTIALADDEAEHQHEAREQRQFDEDLGRARPTRAAGPS